MSNQGQLFGGSWTEEKLGILKKYLQAYIKVLKYQPFELLYIDAFAGTGYRQPKHKKALGPPTLELFPNRPEQLLDGSSRIALQVEPPFHKYVFVDMDERQCKALAVLKDKFSAPIDVRNEEANACLANICRSTDWKSTRAVLFLDPFGMQVKWETVELIAATRAIDLWYLFPLGIAVNRLLRKDGKIEDWAKQRLDEIFGTTEWYGAFYSTVITPTLFGDEERVIKTGNYDLISKFLIQRLQSVFPGVAPNPRPLYSSTNVPLYLFCFAASNPQGADIAIRIAHHILGSLHKIELR